uniref:T-lymphocyte surface antigen Ly-9-like n=1 Tax=Myxine glutinosa TaxID=7769 RepID=UPI00358F5C97
MHAGAARVLPGLPAVRTLGVLWLLWFVSVVISPGSAKINVTTPEPRLNVLKGQDAFFFVTFTSSVPPEVRWNFVANNGDSREIAAFNVTNSMSINIEINYKDRLIGHPSGSLTLKNVLKADVGTYTAQFVTYSSESNTGIKITLEVYDTLTGFSISKKGDPTPDNSTVTLMCKSASSLESRVTYNWSLNGVAVEAGLRFKINDSSLIVNMTESIRGFFRCVASNPLNHASSDYYFLPCCTALTGSPMKEVVEVIQGNSVKFNLKESTEEIFAVEWHFKNSQKQLAVSMLNITGLVDSAYTKKVDISLKNGSLTIYGVQWADAGTYTASVWSSQKRWEENFKLDVKDPINRAALIGGLVGGIGGFLLLLLLAIALFICYRHKKKVDKLNNKPNETATTGIINASPNKDTKSSSPAAETHFEGKKNLGFHDSFGDENSLDSAIATSTIPSDRLSLQSQTLANYKQNYPIGQAYLDDSNWSDSDNEASINNDPGGDMKIRTITLV